MSHWWAIAAALLVARCDSKREPPKLATAAPTVATAAPPEPKPSAADEFRAAERLRIPLSEDGIARAAAAYQRACNGGHQVACSALALQYQDGRGVPHDEEKAIELHERACSGGAGIGCFNLGLMYLTGNGVDADRARANGYFAKARTRYDESCRRGEHEWCLNLGVMLENGYELAPDPAAARARYLTSCTAGHSDSCANLALVKLDGGAVDEAINMLQRACEQSSAVACTGLGHALLQGKREPARMVAALRRGCDLGASRGCELLGAVYGLGEAVPPDPVQARDLQERACRGGSPGGCMMRAFEEQTAGRIEAARLMFERACWIGDREACRALR